MRAAVSIALVLAASVGPTWAQCVDNDGDGFGVNGDPSCPGGTVPDCWDGSADVYPGAPEICDGVSNDCDDPLWPDLEGWVENPISTTAIGASSVTAGDLDGDGDMDVVSSLGWYENTAGDGSTWTLHEGPGGNVLADIDGDGDQDILATDWIDDDKYIIWHENVLGNGQVWVPHNILRLNQYQGTQAIAAADMDGDNDQDVVTITSVEGDENKIEWFENETGSGTTWSSGGIIRSDFDNWIRMFVGDVDGDDDVDVLSTIPNGDVLEWLEWQENVAGDGTVWSAHPIPAGSPSAVIFGADLDGDGNLDALSAPNPGSEIVWHRNAAGDGSTWQEQLIPTTLFWNFSIPLTAADLDGDSDQDLLLTDRSSNVAWLENTAGDGSSWTQHVITPNGPSRAVLAADLDGDGDPEAISGSNDWEAIVSYEHHSVEGDDDGDGLANCDGDCDGDNPHCTTDCTDADGDRYCITTDCDDSVASCNSDCSDGDGDGFRACDTDCDDGNDTIYPELPRPATC